MTQRIQPQGKQLQGEGPQGARPRRLSSFRRPRSSSEENNGEEPQRPAFLRRYAWAFVVVGLAGNAMFFVGSICFLSERSQTAGVWMFILGSGLMLVSSAAGVIDEYAQRQRE
ncbi:hypothetical protein Mal64_07550 [Pseudobythopirellula maris]|uniref:YrhK domain-containing protein n=1 Tax=Pseudobythopirellula maris TaxID=2527991 RepID=A0A5C5ZT14_9BACT|nr:hypothetical protein Mal64_07550 [Pseudobythopirellula maris]